MRMHKSVATGTELYKLPRMENILKGGFIMAISLSEKVKVSIQRLKNFAPDDSKYYVAYSGGKDSDAVRILCALADVPYELHYNLTTADAPETVNYIKSVGGVSIDKSRYSDGTHKTMWNLIVKKGFPPTRLMRYCCSELKEQGGKGCMKVIGVRWAESNSRSVNSAVLKVIGKPRTVEKFAHLHSISYDKTKQGGIILNYDNSDSRRLAEFCYRTTSTMLSPIVDWSDSDVWEFLHYYGCSSNPLYQCGFKRVGCIGCPLGGTKSQKFEFGIYPKIKNSYIRAFDDMLSLHPNYKYNWSTGRDVFNWWLGLDSGQLSFDGLSDLL